METRFLMINGTSCTKNNTLDHIEWLRNDGDMPIQSMDPLKVGKGTKQTHGWLINKHIALHDQYSVCWQVDNMMLVFKLDGCQHH